MLLNHILLLISIIQYIPSKLSVRVPIDDICIHLFLGSSSICWGFRNWRIRYNGSSASKIVYADIMCRYYCFWFYDRYSQWILQWNNSKGRFDHIGPMTGITSIELVFCHRWIMPHWYHYYIDTHYPNFEVACTVTNNKGIVFLVVRYWTCWCALGHLSKS